MRRTDKSLLDQMLISDIEIERRMELLNLSRSDLELLASYQQLIEENVDIIVGEFYNNQLEVDEISLLIGDADTLVRLQTAQRKYVLDLFSGNYDGEYVNNRLRIGMVHKRIGVEPKLYLSAVRTLKEIIVATLRRTLSSDDQLRAVVDVLDKLLYFDVTLVFDTYIDCLVGEIENAVHRTEMYAKSLEEKVAERTKQLERLAKLDPLTNIYNRRAMREMLRREISLAKRHKSKISLVYFDVDDFKAINDKFGHIKGDEVLKSVGQILVNCVRETDIPCRYGGDEFCLILSECNAESAKITCEKILLEFANRYPQFFLSMGIAEMGPDDSLDENGLIKMADELMYLAKKEKGSFICL